jgi:hypothetical protein
MTKEIVYDPETGRISEITFEGTKVEIKNLDIEFLKADPDQEKNIKELIEKIEKFISAKYDIRRVSFLRILAYYVLINYFYKKAEEAGVR